MSAPATERGETPNVLITPPYEIVGTWLRAGSGSGVATAFHRALAVIFAVAWLSLASQVILLIGSSGLLPLNELVSRAELSFWRFPSIFIGGASDAVLLAGTGVGFALAVVALFGIYPRVCVAINTLLYLSYTTACQDFFLFQWDSMLIECGFLAVLLPPNRPLPIVHIAFRLLLFKLYFESGIAKWNSPLHDWTNGEAMTHYYETAPLPTWLGYWAHNLPDWWHHIESRLVLVLELAVPLLFFGPRRGRLIAAGLLTGFQLINIATANYGFFVYLSLSLHLFLLDERDLERARSWAKRRLPRRLRDIDLAFLPSRWMPRPRLGRLGRAGNAVVRPLIGVWVVLSVIEGLAMFGNVRALDRPLRRHYAPFRMVNTYHLFTGITTRRYEPSFETFDGTTWTAHHLHHKPGAPTEAGSWVAPHQPRVDFHLWFYGLSDWHRPPRLVLNLRDRLCSPTKAVQRLFRRRLPKSPQAVRIVIHRYEMTTPGERARTGHYWRRERKRAVAFRRCRLAASASKP